MAGAHLTTTPHKVTSTETTTVIFGLAPGYYLVKDVDGSQTADPSKESEKATAATSEESTSDTVELTVDAPGYYLVKDKDGSQNSKNGAYTRFMMQVTGAESVEVKNDVPTVEKKVKENSNSEWQYAADYDMGDTVPFQLTAELPKKRVDDYNHYYVEFTDTLSAGLTFKEITKVTADGTTLTKDQYQVTTTEKDGKTVLSIVITDVKAVADIT